MRVGIHIRIDPHGDRRHHAKLLRQALGIEIFVRSGNLRLKGSDEEVSLARQRIEHVLGKFRKGRELSSERIETILLGPPSAEEDSVQAASVPPTGEGKRRHRVHPMLHARMRGIEPRGKNQRLYLDLMDRVAAEALATARAGDLGNGTNKISAMTGFQNAVKKKIKIIDSFLTERPLFNARLQETELRDGAEGRIAIEDYYQRLLDDRQRIADYSDGVDKDYGLALAAAIALKDQHVAKIALADKGKEYLALRDQIGTEIARLQGGAAGGEQAAEAIAVTQTAMNDAVNLSQAGDWHGAIYLLKNARSELRQGTRAAKIAADIDGMQDTDALDNIAGDFDAALAQFQKAATHIDGLDADDVFAAQLKAAEQTAESGRGMLPGDPDGARAQIEAGIAACKEIGTKLTQLQRCKDQVTALTESYETLKSRNLDKVLDPELSDIKARLKTVDGMMKPKSLDLPGALAELAAVRVSLRVGYDLEGLYKNRCKPMQSRVKALRKLLEKKDVAPGLGDEIERVKDIEAAMQTALDTRDLTTLRAKINEGLELEKPFKELATSYKRATASYEQRYTKTGIKTVQHAAVNGQLTRIRDIIDGVDQLMAQHAYQSAYYQIEKTSYLIDRALKAIADFPAYETAMTAADTAMQDLLDRGAAVKHGAGGRIRQRQCGGEVFGRGELLHRGDAQVLGLGGHGRASLSGAPEALSADTKKPPHRGRFGLLSRCSDPGTQNAVTPPSA